MVVRRQSHSGSDDAGHTDLSQTSRPRQTHPDPLPKTYLPTTVSHRDGWTRMARERNTTHGERAPGESCMVCQTFVSMFGLWILIGDASSTLQPGRLEITCFPLQPANRNTPMHTSGHLSLSRLEASRVRVTPQCHPPAVHKNTQRVTM